MTLIEFGLAGVPAIVYDKEPINQIVKNNHNGFVCKPFLPSLIELIENISNEPSILESVSKNVFDDFVDCYNADTSIKAVVDIYRRLT